MGRPYRSELDKIPATFDWARQLDLTELLPLIRPLDGLPLLVVGSGGSLSVAHFAADLHERRTGNMAVACTPAELSARSDRLRQYGVLIISAGGRNPDVLTALEKCVTNEAQWTVVLCGMPGSPLARLARSSEFVGVAELSFPGGKDGFLATNSIVAFITILNRMFLGVPQFAGRSSENLSEILVQPDELLDSVTLGSIPDFLQRETFVVLHGTDTKPAAVDFESKATEAALARVQAADFRNFGHGRHHWLAKRGAESGVLALSDDSTFDLARKTLSLLPDSIPKLLVHLPGTGTRSAFHGFIYVLGLIGRLGTARGIDPGRPGVPDFGSQLYHLRIRNPARVPVARKITQAAIRRKIQASDSLWPSAEEQEIWSKHLSRVLSSLSAAAFDKIAFDYDGTLCTLADRFSGLTRQIAKKLQRLLEDDVWIGIATGRGDSVREDLRRALDSRFWEKILVGYYNGAEIAYLDDDRTPARSNEPGADLKVVEHALRQDLRILSRATLKTRASQITLLPKQGEAPEILWKLVQECLTSCDSKGFQVVTSTHSVDVLAPGVSKIKLVRAMEERAATEAAILCIGDRANWPGNDFAFLRCGYSLSVDQVSSDPESAWHLAPPGCRGTKATEFYLDCMQIRSGKFQMNLPRSIS